MTDQNIKINTNALRIGWYADKYFLRTQEILSKDNYDHQVHYQYFPRKNVIVCGIPHVIQILRNCMGFYKDRQNAWITFERLKDLKSRQKTYSDKDFLILNEITTLEHQLEQNWSDMSAEVEIHALREGSEVKDMEPIIGLIGNPKYFAHLETPTLGILAQQSAVATSVREAVKRLTNKQSLLFFPARFRHYLSQAPDGYAAVVGGAEFLSTDSNGEYWGYNGIGTIPHLLIAAYGGNTSLAALKFDEYIDPSIDRVILVDWDNNCIKTTLEVVLIMLQKHLAGDEHFEDQSAFLRSLSINNLIYKCRDMAHHLKEVIGKGKGKLFGVRFDTSGSQVDKTFTYESYKGVCPELVKKARYQFDELGLQDLKIIVSGGFDIEKIERFQALNTPVDMFGIGSSIVNKFSVDFTADAVTLDGKPNAKVGRKLMDWSRMTRLF